MKFLNKIKQAFETNKGDVQETKEELLAAEQEAQKAIQAVMVTRDLDAMRTVFNQFLSSNASDADAQTYQSTLLKTTGSEKKALERKNLLRAYILTNLAEKDPGNAEALFMLADALKNYRDKNNEQINAQVSLEYFRKKNQPYVLLHGEVLEKLGQEYFDAGSKIKKKQQQEEKKTNNTDIAPAANQNAQVKKGKKNKEKKSNTPPIYAKVKAQPQPQPQPQPASSQSVSEKQEEKPTLQEKPVNENQTVPVENSVPVAKIVEKEEIKELPVEENVAEAVVSTVEEAPFTKEVNLQAIDPQIVENLYQVFHEKDAKAAVWLAKNLRARPPGLVNALKEVGRPGVDNTFALMDLSFKLSLYAAALKDEEAIQYVQEKVVSRLNAQNEKLLETLNLKKEDIVSFLKNNKDKKVLEALQKDFAKTVYLPEREKAQPEEEVAYIPPVRTENKRRWETATEQEAYDFAEKCLDDALLNDSAFGAWQIAKKLHFKNVEMIRLLEDRRYNKNLSVDDLSFRFMTKAALLGNKDAAAEFKKHIDHLTNENKAFLSAIGFQKTDFALDYMDKVATGQPVPIPRLFMGLQHNILRYIEPGRAAPLMKGWKIEQRQEAGDLPEMPSYMSFDPTDMLSPKMRSFVSEEEQVEAPQTHEANEQELAPATDIVQQPVVTQEEPVVDEEVQPEVIKQEVVQQQEVIEEEIADEKKKDRLLTLEECRDIFEAMKKDNCKPEDYRKMADGIMQTIIEPEHPQSKVWQKVFAYWGLEEDALSALYEDLEEKYKAHAVRAVEVVPVATNNEEPSAVVEDVASPLSEETEDKEIVLTEQIVSEEETEQSEIVEEVASVLETVQEPAEEFVEETPEIAAEEEVGKEEVVAEPEPVSVPVVKPTAEQLKQSDLPAVQEVFNDLFEGGSGEMEYIRHFGPLLLADALVVHALKNENARALQMVSQSLFNPQYRLKEIKGIQFSSENILAAYHEFFKKIDDEEKSAFYKVLANGLVRDFAEGMKYAKTIFTFVFSKSYKEEKNYPSAKLLMETFKDAESLKENGRKEAFYLEQMEEGAEWAKYAIFRAYVSQSGIDLYGARKEYVNLEDNKLADLIIDVALHASAGHKSARKIIREALEREMGGSATSEETKETEESIVSSKILLSALYRSKAARETGLLEELIVEAAVVDKKQWAVEKLYSILQKESFENKAYHERIEAVAGTKETITVLAASFGNEDAQSDVVKLLLKDPSSKEAEHLVREVIGLKKKNPLIMAEWVIQAGIQENAEVLKYMSYALGNVAGYEKKHIPYKEVLKALDASEKATEASLKKRLVSNGIQNEEEWAYRYVADHLDEAKNIEINEGNRARVFVQLAHRGHPGSYEAVKNVLYPNRQETVEAALDKEAVDKELDKLPLEAKTEIKVNTLFEKAKEGHPEAGEDLLNALRGKKLDDMRKAIFFMHQKETEKENGYVVEIVKNLLQQQSVVAEEVFESCFDENEDTLSDSFKKKFRDAVKTDPDFASVAVEKALLGHAVFTPIVDQMMKDENALAIKSVMKEKRTSFEAEPESILLLNMLNLRDQETIFRVKTMLLENACNLSEHIGVLGDLKLAARTLNKTQVMEALQQEVKDEVVAKTRKAETFTSPRERAAQNGYEEILNNRRHPTPSVQQSSQQKTNGNKTHHPSQASQPVEKKEEKVAASSNGNGSQMGYYIPKKVEPKAEQPKPQHIEQKKFQQKEPIQARQNIEVSHQGQAAEVKKNGNSIPEAKNNARVVEPSISEKMLARFYRESGSELNYARFIEGVFVEANPHACMKFVKSLKDPEDNSEVKVFNVFGSEFESASMKCTITFTASLTSGSDGNPPSSQACCSILEILNDKSLLQKGSPYLDFIQDTGLLPKNIRYGEHFKKYLELADRTGYGAYLKYYAAQEPEYLERMKKKGILSPEELKAVQQANGLDMLKKKAEIFLMEKVAGAHAVMKGKLNSNYNTAKNLLLQLT